LIGKYVLENKEAGGDMMGKGKERSRKKYGEEEIK